MDNNGRILYHPDLRPLDDGSQYSLRLKPKYSSVDIMEVELPEIETSAQESEQDINTNLLLDVSVVWRIRTSTPWEGPSD